MAGPAIFDAGNVDILVGFHSVNHKIWINLSNELECWFWQGCIEAFCQTESYSVSEVAIDTSLTPIGNGTGVVQGSTRDLFHIVPRELGLFALINLLFEKNY